MADRAAAGCDLLAAQIVKTPDRGIFRHHDRKPVARLPHGRDRLDRNLGGGRERERRVADQAGVDRARPKCLQQRRRRGELLPLDLVGNILEYAGRFHHRLRIALLVADAQRGLRGGDVDGGERKRRRDNETDHSAAIPRCWSRASISLRVSGISARP
ncbi:hypothetical protein ACVILL_005088 [Bradyrhizobium sp. USDA 3364]